MREVQVFVASTKLLAFHSLPPGVKVRQGFETACKLSAYAEALRHVSSCRDVMEFVYVCVCTLWMCF